MGGHGQAVRGAEQILDLLLGERCFVVLVALLLDFEHFLGHNLRHWPLAVG